MTSRTFNHADHGTSGYEVELRLRKADGTYRWFHARYRPVVDETGKISRWYVACADIEDRKRAEERLQQENAALRDELDKASMFEEIVGTSPALTSVLSRIVKVAPSDSTVLITGDTGTGKELARGKFIAPLRERSGSSDVSNIHSRRTHRDKCWDSGRNIGGNNRHPKH